MRPSSRVVQVLLLGFLMINKLVCGKLGAEREGVFRVIVEMVVTIRRNQEKCDCANANFAESRREWLMFSLSAPIVPPYCVPIYMRVRAP